MNKRITKREIVFLVFGLFTMLLIDLVWDNNVKSFKEGLNDGLKLKDDQTEMKN